MKKYCFLLILLSSVWTAHAQYLENFTGQNGKGLVDAICPPTATGISDCGCACTSNSSTTDDISTCTVVPPDLTGVTWTITGSDFTGFDHSSPDDFGVVSERFQANDNDNELCWVSPTLNIAAAGAVSISISAGEISDLEATDYIKAEYSLNGGAFVQFGFASDDFTSTTFSISGLTGTTLAIRVCIDINGSSRIIWFDDVSVPQSGVFINCAQPTVTAAVTDVVCTPNSGAIDLTVTGGSPPYTYAWTGGATTQDRTGLAPGTYSVTVTDNASCPIVKSYTVNNSPIVQNAATYPAYCDEANGSINLNVSGGIPPYTYAWTGGATTQDLMGVSAGNYTVTITDHINCTSVQTYTVGTQSVSPGPYLETFSTPNKGYLTNLQDDLFGVNWTLSPWQQGAPGRDASDYFQTTAGGKLEAVDVDFEVCWNSPVINITGAGSVQFSVDLTWQTLEAEDYIAVQYSLDGGAFTELSNIAGSGSHTVQYTSGINTNSGTASISGLTGSTLQIRICFLAESNSDIITIDNVSIPQTVSLCLPPPCAPPDAVCQNITAQLNSAGSASITGADIDNNSITECGLQSLAVDVTDFTCTNLGANTVTLTVTDNQNNTDQCTATVTVQDNVGPTALCRNVTVQLDAGGNGSTTASAVNNGSSDACGIQSLSLDKTAFTCANAGNNTVTLTVTDVNNNPSTCTATVTVADNVAPTALCQNVTIQLDANGNGSTTASAVNNGSSDNCGIGGLSLSQTAFSCGNVGSNTVTLTVTDVNNNPSTCTATVTVEDKMPPAVTCVTSYTVELNANGTYDIFDASFVFNTLFTSISDNCQIDYGVIFLTQPHFTCDDLGERLVGFYAQDGSGNLGGCTVTIIVTDPLDVCNHPPVAVCKNITVNANGNCQGTAAAADFDGGSSDQDMDMLSFSVNPAGPYQIGMTNVTLTVSDGQASSQCSATITVQDNTPPTALCRNVTVQLNGAGMGSTSAAAVNNGSSDNCGIQSTVLSLQSFSCGNVGANTVTLTVTDVNNNSSTCTATVTVTDNIAPTALCQNVTVQLDADGNGATTASAVNNGSSDACGVQSTVLNTTAFDCEDVGANTVTLTVTDVNNNSSTCTATVTVEDNVAPTALCQNVTVQLDANGDGSTTASAVDNGSNDACGVQSAVLSGQSFSCEDVGANTVTLTVTDVNNNSSTCTATVTVEDNVAPTALCQNVTVQLDANGDGSTTATAVDNGSSDACGIQS
ncbi:MAG: SprB repeat-containing protein, partial [Lewinella sp.]|nr:SprB repeat-containing protein [Lewinella sp.]